MILRKHLNLATLFTSLLLIAVSGPSHALPDDRNQPIHIASDTAEIDERTGRSVYRGKVLMTQGSIKLKADQVTIINDGQGISKLIAIGIPAHFQQLPEADKTITHAFGNRIEYFVADERIELIKQAKLEQDQNVFTGERIDYDIKNRVVNAYADKKTHSSKDKPRVNLVIQPNNNSSNGTTNNE